MQAIAVNEYGAAPTMMQLPKPTPAADQVLVKVRAAGMNPMDREISNGGWQGRMPGKFPLVLGSDVAGVVEARGEKATRFAPGDAVFGQLLLAPLGSFGTYAEYVAVGENAPITRMPEQLDPVVAASLPTAGVSAQEIVESLGPLSGKTVLIIGAGGGVGSFATQFAAQAGAHVDADAHADAERRMLDYGAADTWNQIGPSLIGAVREAHPEGIDVVVDTANDADGFAAVASLVRRGGTAMTTKFVADVPALAKAGVTGVNYVKPMTAAALDQIANEIVTGRIVPPPIRRIALGGAPAALNGHFDGKTIIVL
jgi:NADPH:quinone reductase-like Zn-dependent oxidoreductase